MVAIVFPSGLPIILENFSQHEFAVTPKSTEAIIRLRLRERIPCKQHKSTLAFLLKIDTRRVMFLGHSPRYRQGGLKLPLSMVVSSSKCHVH